jgi:hypothetical protein
MQRPELAPLGPPVPRQAGCEHLEAIAVRHRRWQRVQSPDEYLFNNSIKQTNK